MASTTFSGWDYHNYHVQQDLTGGQFISAESTLIGAGPPTLSANGNSSTAVTSATDTDIYPLGLLESAAIQQNKQLQRIFEIGSSRSYFIPGRTIGSVSIGRTFYFGPSLLLAMYAYYKTKEGGTFNLAGGTGTDAPLLTSATEHAAPKRTPGFGYFLIDLASDLFSQPTGLCSYFKDAQDNVMGAFYMNECYVQGHQMTISSGSVLIMEGVSVQFDSISPIKSISAAAAAGT